MDEDIMSDINFYHIKNASTESALAMLLQKTLSNDKKAILRCYNSSLLEHYDQTLWTIQKDIFLPHGTSTDALPEKQPIYITTENDNPNDAKFLFISAFSSTDHINIFERVFILFEDKDPEAVSWAREIWKDIKETDHTQTYWLQNEAGKWEKKG